VTVGSATTNFTGGAGADTLVFASLAQIKNGNARDVFTDFTVGTTTTAGDKIDLSSVDANVSQSGTQHFAFNDATALWSGSLNSEFTGTPAGLIRYHYQTVSGVEHTILDLHTTAAGAADHQIDLGAGHKTIHAADLVLA
jgi:hypothetical protein